MMQIGMVLPTSVETKAAQALAFWLCSDRDGKSV